METIKLPTGFQEVDITGLDQEILENLNPDVRVVISDYGQYMIGPLGTLPYITTALDLLDPVVADRLHRQINIVIGPKFDYDPKKMIL